MALPQSDAGVAAQITSPEMQFELAKVTVSSRLPEFWTDQPRNWFLQIETILKPQKLSDQAKFDLVITKLSKDAIGQVTDLLIEPPETEKFETLKRKLLSIYEESATRQLQKLLSEMELGDQKPSQLLRRMRELAHKKVPDDTLRILWQNHLLPATRAVLAVADSKNLESLATAADTVMDATRPMQVAEVTPERSKQNTSTLILAEIAKLSARIAHMENQQMAQPRSSQYQSRGRPRSRSREFNFRRGRSSSGSNRRTPDSPDWLCSYHYRFRENARRCTASCAWKQPGN